MGFFFTVEHDTDNDTVKNGGGTLDDIQVPQGDRVKAAGIDRNFQ
jgi:hypothetical protein